MRSLKLLLFVLYFLSGCATKEYLAEEQICLKSAYQKYPQDIREYNYTMTKHVQRPTGAVKCNSTGRTTYDASGSSVYGSTNAQTYCAPVTEQVLVHEDRVGNKDFNRAVRDNWTENCTQNSCLKIFGNSSCKPKKEKSANSTDLSIASHDKPSLKVSGFWLDKDTENAVSDLIKQIEGHKAFQKYLAKTPKKPKLFIAEVQNETSEAYFPIDNINDELLYQIPKGKVTLIDHEQKIKILKKIRYQNDGMVKSEDIRQIGNQSEADILISGSVRMQPVSIGGKTLKQYSINLKMTEIEYSKEVLKVNTEVLMSK